MMGAARIAGMWEEFSRTASPKGWTRFGAGSETRRARSCPNCPGKESSAMFWRVTTRRNVRPAPGAHRTLSNFMNRFLNRSTSSLSTAGPSQRPLSVGWSASSLTVGPLDNIVQDRARGVAHGGGRTAQTVLLLLRRGGFRSPCRWRGGGGERGKPFALRLGGLPHSMKAAARCAGNTAR